MKLHEPQGTIRRLSITSLIFGALGGAFYWWLPMGIVFSLIGLVFSFVDATIARRRSLDFRLSIVAMLLSGATLTLGVVIALLNLQTWTFGGQ